MQQSFHTVLTTIMLNADSSSKGMTKAHRTRAQILDVAQRDASILGIDALTIGGLAKSCGLSKSGLNAHFGSKEALQLAVIDEAAMRFRSEVAEPALAAPPGRARLLAIMEHWIAWSQHPSRPGGCQLISAAFDFDGLQGVVRDSLNAWITQWRNGSKVSVSEANAVDNLKLEPEHTATLAFGTYMAQHIEWHLMKDETAPKRAMESWRDAVSHQRNAAS